MTYIKNEGLCFEGSGTESSRRFIHIFLEDSVTVLKKTNHIIITLTTEKRRKQKNESHIQHPLESYPQNSNHIKIKIRKD